MASRDSCWFGSCVSLKKDDFWTFRCRQTSLDFDLSLHLHLHWKTEDLHQQALHHSAISHLKEHQPENNSSQSAIMWHIQEIPSVGWRRGCCISGFSSALLTQAVEVLPRGRRCIPASPTRCRHQSRRAMTYGLGRFIFHLHSNNHSVNKILGFLCADVG